MKHVSVTFEGIDFNGRDVVSTPVEAFVERSLKQWPERWPETDEEKRKAKLKAVYEASAAAVAAADQQEAGETAPVDAKEPVQPAHTPGGPVDPNPPGGEGNGDEKPPKTTKK